MAFKFTLNGLVVAVACNPVEVLVALTVTVCWPAETLLYWKPEEPTVPKVIFIYVTIVLQVTRIVVHLLVLLTWHKGLIIQLALKSSSLISI